MIGHLVRRAAEQLSHSQFLEKQANAFAKLHYELPQWGAIMLALTVVFFAIAGFLFEYIVRLLIVNLAIVESPTSATVSIYKPVKTSEDPDAPLEKQDPYADVEIEKATVFSKPITSSIRSTVLHLVSIGGFRARWRGIRYFAIYSTVVGIVHLFTMRLPVFLALIFGSFGGALMAARLHCAWTHATISMPSKKTLSQRLISPTQWRQVAAPTIVKVGATQLSGFLTVTTTVLSVIGLNDLIEAKSQDCFRYMFWLAAPVVVAASTFLGLVLPAYVVLIRIEASLLPEDEDTIVPVDRTFGGRTDETTGLLTAKDAWKGFTKEAYLRVIKLYAKYFFMTIGLACFAVQVLALEVYYIMGDDFFVLLDSISARMEILGF